MSYKAQRKMLIEDLVSGGADREQATRRIMNLSRSRIWQLLKAREGRCTVCGSQETVTKLHCAKHAKQNSEISRRYKLNRGPV